MRGRYIPTHICQAYSHSRWFACKFSDASRFSAFTPMKRLWIRFQTLAETPLKKKNNRFMNRCLFFLLNITRYNSFLPRTRTHFFSFFLISISFSLTSLITRVVAYFTSLYYHHRSHISLMELYVEYIFQQKRSANFSIFLAIE